MNVKDQPEISQETPAMPDILNAPNPTQIDAPQRSAQTVEPAPKNEGPKGKEPVAPLELEIKPTGGDDSPDPQPVVTPEKPDSESSSSDDAGLNWSSAPAKFREAHKRLSEELETLKAKAQQADTATGELAETRERVATLEKQLQQSSNAAAGLGLPDYDPSIDPDFIAKREAIRKNHGQKFRALGKAGAELVQDIDKWYADYAKVNWQNPKSVEAWEDKIADQFGDQRVDRINDVLTDYFTENAQLQQMAATGRERWAETVSRAYDEKAKYWDQQFGELHGITQSDIDADPLSAKNILAHQIQSNPTLKKYYDEVAALTKRSALGLRPVNPDSLSPTELEERQRMGMEIQDHLNQTPKEYLLGKVALALLPAMQRQINQLSRRAGTLAKDENIPGRSEPSPPKPKGDGGNRASIINPEDLAKMPNPTQLH